MVAALNAIVASHMRVLREIAEWKVRNDRRRRSHQPALQYSKRAKARNTLRNRDYRLESMANMSDINFQRMFRLSREAFGILL